MTHFARSMGLALLIAAGTFATAHADVSETRTELQVAMQRHIDRTLVNGALLHIDPETGALQELYPTKAHPMVMQGEGYFVLCADLRTTDGQSFEVDYYLVESDRGYRVIRTEIDNRPVLRRLIDAGRVKRF